MNLNRRELFTLAGAGTLAYLIDGCTPTFQPVLDPMRPIVPTVRPLSSSTADIAGPVIPPETYMHPRLLQLGRELTSWSANGQRIVDRFVEARQVSELLTGRINPSNFLPRVRLPIGYTIDPKLVEAGGQLEFTWNADPDDPRKNVVAVQGKSYESYWIKELVTPISLAPDVDRSTARLPVVLKEASQIVDYSQYCNLYLELMRAYGYTTTIEPTPPTSSLNESAINQANALRNVEVKVVPLPNNNWPLLETIIDVGSLLRSSIYFGIWLDEPTERELKISTRRWVLGGKDALGFMIDRRMIRRDGLRLVWSTGKPPEIVDKDFWGLIKGYSGIKLP